MKAKNKDRYDDLIYRMEEAMENTQDYQSIVNGYCDGEPHHCLSRDEAERLADSWARDIDKLSDESNLTIDTVWDTLVLSYASKRKMLAKADKNRRRGKMSITIA